MKKKNGWMKDTYLRFSGIEAFGVRLAFIVWCHRTYMRGFYRYQERGSIYTSWGSFVRLLFLRRIIY